MSVTNKEITSASSTSIQSVARRLISGCLFLSLAITPVGTSLAEQGYITMQYEFSPGGKPRFRQVSLVIRDEAAERDGPRLIDTESFNVAVPLYSLDRSRPGLFNLPGLNSTRLESSAADDRNEEEDRRKAARVVTILGAIGILGYFVYKRAKANGCPEVTWDYKCDYFAKTED